MRALLAGARQKEPALLDLIQELVRPSRPPQTRLPWTTAPPWQRRAKSRAGASSSTSKGIGRSPGGALRTKSRTGAAGRTLLLGPSGHRLAPRHAQDDAMPPGSRSFGEPRLWGPGTFDMKAGAAMAFTAIELLVEAGALRREIVLLLTSDEEVGSRSRGRSSNAWPPSAPRSSFSSRRRGWLTRPPAKALGDWRIAVTAWPPMPEWTLKKARAPSVSWPASSRR